MLWIIIFLPILFLLCLGRLLILKRWEYVSSLVLGCLQFIQIRISPLCSLFFFSLLILSLPLGISNVYAQTETPTPEPTPTYQSIYDDVDIDYSDPNVNCPGDQPTGWGAVTPDPAWLMNCAHCITPDASAYDWGDHPGWGDNPFVPTPTLTSTPNENIVFDMRDHEDDLLEPGVGYIDNYVLGDGFIFYALKYDVITSLAAQSYEFTVEIEFDYSVSYTHYVPEIYIQLNNDFGTAEIYIMDGIGEGNTYTLVGNQDQWLQISEFEPPGKRGFGMSYYTAMQVKVTNSDKNFRDGVIAIRKTGTVGESSIMNVGIRWFEGLVIPEPEYPATPTPDSDYCASVNAHIGGGNYDPSMDDKFDLGGIWVGTPTCFTIGGFEIPIEWINNFIGTGFANPQIPGTQWCFTPIEFGSLKLFNIEIDLDFIAMGMSGVLLFRFITRS